MNLHIINPIEYPDWDELLLTNENTSFFHTSEWAKVLHGAYGYTPFYFATIEDNKLTTLIPMMEVKSMLTGKRGVSLPFTDNCEPIVMDQQLFDMAIEQIRECGRKKNWKHIEWRGGSDNFKKASSSLSFYSHDVKLNETEEKLFSSLKSSTRRNIKNAQSRGVEVSLNNTLDAVKQFFKLNCMTRKKHGLPPQPFIFFNKLFKDVISKKKGFVALAFSKKKAIAGAVFLHFNKKAVYKYGASDEGYLNMRPNNLLMWEAIKHYAKESFSNFSFGITEMENQGLLQFKRGWGATESLVNYYRYSLKNNEFIKDSFRAKTSYPIFKKMPSPVLNAIGYLLYRHIG
ncbi:MAG: peptidoglycan bridge formation glycyltransferase FemA/FemB family protein [Deltaproteobacteria bacterium]|nr:peptidoglycan bridge formation glycyltransferase FemA/FemB family protein [Deltaproteobacteria bacterium]